MKYLSQFAGLSNVKYVYRLCAISLPYYILVALLAISPAAAADQPSKADIAMTITRSIMKNGPPNNITGWLGMAQNVRVDEVNITAIGRVQKKGDQEYIPVKADVSGSFQPVAPFPMGPREPVRQFKGEVEFAIYQDPYGKWQGRSLR